MKRLNTLRVDDVIDTTNFREKHWLEIKSIAEMLNKRGKELWKQVFSADEKRRTQIGKKVSFVVNRNINFTPYCIGSCRFCSYRKILPKDYFDASEVEDLLLESIRKEVRKAVEWKCSEVCIQGGLDPRLSFDFYVNILKTVKSIASNIHIHAFSPAEIAYMSQLSGETVEDVFLELKRHGLDSFPGTAAEILVDKIRKIICPEKISTEEWINIVTTGHIIGLKSSATMMYGHIETVVDEAEHLVLLKAIQEETKGFTEFVPLPFVHQNTVLYKKMKAQAGSTGLHDIAIFSTARLYLGEIISNLQVSWVKLGPKFAQAALDFGANDFGGTLFVESISKSAGAKYGERITKKEIIRLIKDAQKIPVERDTVYNIIKEYN